MGFLLVETAKAISAQGLHEADVNIGVVEAHKGVAFERDKIREPEEILVEQLLTHRGRQIGLGIKQERSDVVLQRALASPLVIDKPGTGVAEHDVPGLKISIKEIFAGGAQQEFGQTDEIVFKGLFVERDSCEPEKIIFEIIQVPGNRLAIEEIGR